MVARLLAQYFIDHTMPFTGYDTDRSHGALMRYYAGYASPVLADRFEALDAIVESAASEPGRRVLVDLAAQTHAPLVKWMDESGVLDLADVNGMSIYYWHVMDAGRDSVDLLARLLDQFGPRLHYVLVRNQIRGDDFSQLDKSGEQTRALALGGQVITLKHLHDPVVQKIDAANASFWAARNVTDKSGPGLGMMERQRLKMWMAHAMAEIDKVAV
jgi:hypothetical protein